MAGFNNLNDEQVKMVILEQISIRRRLSELCVVDGKPVIFDDCATDRVLVYEPKDLVRIARIFDTTVVSRPNVSKDTRYKYEGIIEIYGMCFVTYAIVEEELLNE